MLQSDQSTGAQHVNALEGLSYADEHVTSARLVRNADPTVLLALVHQTDALTTEVHDWDRKAATLPASAGREQNNYGCYLNFDIPTPQQQRPMPTFHALQEWEGYVIEVGDTVFVARLVDLTAGSSHEQEEADIPLDEISDKDSAKMRPGSVFRWVIGYERSAAGTKKRVSQIVFRDLPEITKTDLRDGEVWASDTIRSLKL